MSIAITPRLAGAAIGGILTFAGVAHLTFARKEFQAQVPEWIPLDEDFVVVASGVVEIGLGAGLLTIPRARRLFGRAAAGFFVAVFPGNLAQAIERKDGFGLDSDLKRIARLPFQIPLVWLSLRASGDA